MASLVGTAKIVRNRVGSVYYHQRHRFEARQILRALEQDGNRLDPQVRKQCDAYAVEVLGWQGYAPWLHVMAAVRGSFAEGWIPDNYYGAVVLPAVNGMYGENLSKMRFINGTLFPSDMPTLDVVGVVNGRYLDTAAAAPLTRDEAFARLGQQPEGIIFKGDFSYGGQDIAVIRNADIPRVDLTRFNNGIFQRLVTQAASFEEIIRGPVATLRLTTVREDSGAITLRGAYLGLGRSGEACLRGDSLVRVPVDRADGTLADDGYMLNMQRVAAHPDTGVRFAGRTVPSFEACCNFVRACHLKVSYVQCIGWDVAVDAAERPWLLEWNGGHNDIKFSEATQGPCFDDLGWETIWRRADARSKRDASRGT
jgi:hypothetical protein